MKKKLVKGFLFISLLFMLSIFQFSVVWASSPEFKSPYYYVFDLFLRTLNLPVSGGAVVQYADSFEGYLKATDNQVMLNKLEDYKRLSWNDTVSDINPLLESLNDWISLSSCENVGNQYDSLQTFSIDLPSFPDPLPSLIGMEGVQPTPFSDVNIPSDVEGYVYLYSDSHLERRNGRDVCVRRNIYAPDGVEVLAAYDTHNSNFTSLNFGSTNLKSISTIYYTDDYSIVRKDTAFSDSFSRTGAYYHFCSLMNLPFYTFSSFYSLNDYRSSGVPKHMFTDSKVTLWGMGKYKNDFSLNIDSMYLCELTLPSGYSSLSSVKYSDSNSFLSALQDAGLDIADRGTYTLETYKEDTEGNFVKEKTENLIGGVGRTPYISETYPNFSLQEDLTTPKNGVVLEDGSLTVRAYYARDRIDYKVEYYKQNKEGTGWIKEETQNLTGLFGADASFTPKTYQGFTYQENLIDPSNRILSHDTDLTIKLYYNRNAYNYKVEHYKQNLDGETYVKTDTDNLSGLFENTAEFIQKDYTGFSYKAEKTVPVDKKIPANNNLIIKLYYDRDSHSYIVEHYLQDKDGQGWTKKKVESLTGLFGADAFFAPTNYTGFTFSESLTEPDSRIIPAADNLVIKLYYLRNLVSYSVEHYKQQYEPSGSFSWILSDTDLLSGLFDAEPTFTEKSYTGFTFDSALTDSGNIPASDGDLTIKLYYKRNPVEYIVEHYTENAIKDINGSSSWKLMDRESLMGFPGCLAACPQKQYSGFFFDSSLTEPESRIISEDNRLTVRLYYTQDLFGFLKNPVDTAGGKIIAIAVSLFIIPFIGFFLIRLFRRILSIGA